MYTDPLVLANSVPVNISFVRQTVNGNASTWIATNPGATLRQTLVIRHTAPVKVKGSSFPIYRSNVSLKIEKYDSTNEIWNAQTCSMTLTHGGINGAFSATEFNDLWTEMKSFMVTASAMDQLRRQEV